MRRRCSKEPLPRSRGRSFDLTSSFEYEKGRASAKGRRFSFEEDRPLALVARRPGKSTILTSRSQCLSTTKGSIGFDGKDLDTVRLRDYRRHIGASAGIMSWLMGRYSTIF